MEKDVVGLIAKEQEKRQIAISFDCETFNADEAAEGHIRQFKHELIGLDVVGKHIFKLSAVNIGKMSTMGLDFKAESNITKVVITNTIYISNFVIRKRHRCYLEYPKLCSENWSNRSSIEIFIVLLFTNPPRYGTGAILSFFVYKLVCVYILLWLVKLLKSFLRLKTHQLLESDDEDDASSGDCLHASTTGFLGLFQTESCISATRSADGLFLFLHKYAIDILEHPSMLDCKSTRTHADLSTKLDGSGSPVDDLNLYRSLVGALRILLLMDYSFIALPLVSLLSILMRIGVVCGIQNLLLELHCSPDRAPIVYCDNDSVDFMPSNTNQHQQTKLIEIDLHFVCDKVATGHIWVLRVPSSFQYVDIVTKILPSPMFLDFRSSLNTTDNPLVSTMGDINGPIVFI
ncbi:unnamed protein product [Lactuca saligna]|uniref:Uncharacterized protein n=1 Tax=Lactuca saligna TaxID=75948 RepID=A0AA35YC02_LACSI|nr:unnamed protein product [Lactuca saligna]